MARSHAVTAKQHVNGFERMLDPFRSLFSPAGKRVRIPRAWADERGTDVLRGTVDALGGFPGSLRAQHCMRGTTLHITDAYLIVGEGTALGFALPLDRIRATTSLPQGGLQPPLLVVWYQDGDLVGSFALRFRGTTRNLRGVAHADRAHSQLQELGVPAVDPQEFTPPVFVRWDDAEELSHDEVLWHGNAIASSAGPFACQMDECQLWITEYALLWVPRHGTGMNSLPLESIVCCRDGHGDRLSIALEDDLGARYDIYFDLGSRENLNQPAAQVQQLLAAAGVLVEHSNPPLAPWRSGGIRRPVDY